MVTPSLDGCDGHYLWLQLKFNYFWTASDKVSTVAVVVNSRELDIVIFGATGYTGRLVAERLVKTRSDHPDLRWALAGRSLDKLAATRELVGAPADLPLIEADSADPVALEALARRTKVVITTAGPYQRLGSELVAACARAGTDYLDLTGEAVWMRQMIDQHEEEARRSGARILFACGFDSIPTDLGVWFCQQVAQASLGAPVPRVRGRIRGFAGAISGGSAATRDSMIAATAADPAYAELLGDSFALTPGFRGPEQPPMDVEADDPDLGRVVSFPLGVTNAMSVHRTNLLLGHPYGKEFQYDEMLVAPADGGSSLPPEILLVQPEPGDGPSPEERLAGSFDMVFFGVAPDGRQVQVSVIGDQDPGYGSTSQMLAETALCLLEADDLAPGMWTPAAALGQSLLDRLQERTGVSFTDETA